MAGGAKVGASVADERTNAITRPPHGLKGRPDKGPPIVAQPASQHIDQPLPHHSALLYYDTDQPLPIRASRRELLDLSTVAAPEPGGTNDSTVIPERTIGPQQLLEKPLFQLKLGVRLVQLLPHERLMLVSLDQFERLGVKRQRGGKGNQEHTQPQRRGLNQPVVPATENDLVERDSVIAVSQQHLSHLVALYEII